MKAPSATNDPAHWRTRADEARQMGEQTADAVVRQAMQEVAAAYERLAKLTEERPLQGG
jgi:hypothetical protein